MVALPSTATGATGGFSCGIVSPFSDMLLSSGDGERDWECLSILTKALPVSTLRSICNTELSASRSVSPDELSKVGGGVLLCTMSNSSMDWSFII